MVRRHWPAAYILIITNGFFLHRHPGLPATLAAAGNCELALSIHHDGAAYTERLRPIFDLLVDWRRDHGTKVQIRRSQRGWTRRYHGFGADMLPFEDGQPKQSWKVCGAKHCKQLHDGKIWKCPPLAYLRNAEREIRPVQQMGSIPAIPAARGDLHAIANWMNSWR